MDPSDDLPESNAKMPAGQSSRKVDQSGAICCRVEKGGRVSVLLVTSRDSGRWVIPKGYLQKKEKPYRCAQREALEEAGVIGKVRKRPLGYYTYLKDNETPLTVSVHLLRFKEEGDQFPERTQRQKIWIAPAEAAELVEEPELQALFRSVDTDNPLSSQDRLKPRRIAGRRSVADVAVSLATLPTSR
ncbi:8-oxo-dGTP pyrophosphatase MutT (NUDIX family) [Rhizobium sp. BK650]|uniref:NUDIX hydrolase n=1 Tax=Rhizobium sp. BK650 TaxID=2586990 RepID=UPI001618E308|nr:NUDIX hydrolase [Rhizobium sp. BK650]MBB3656880.1 8-oxo-dGTP pyrophosphatase MutT (NUDIX family) [Rhizobium sp. BK650]